MISSPIAKAVEAPVPDELWGALVRAGLLAEGVAPIEG